VKKARHRLNADDEEELRLLLQLRRSLNAKHLMERFNVSRSVIDRIQRDSKMLAVPCETKIRRSRMTPDEIEVMARELGA
jgi:hypothetical protein